MIFGASVVLTGCLSPGYEEAEKETPPPELFNIPFAPSRLDATFNTVITYNGPGSWKRNAFWDEYVGTLHNPGGHELTVNAVGLVDFAGAVRPDGGDPWALEKKSKTLEQKYRAAGMAFVRYTAPGVLILGSGTAVVLGSGLFSAGAGAAAAATLVAIPVYYLGVIYIDHYNRVAMEAEFSRRRIVLPLTLAPGNTLTGSFFFPRVPGPRSLSIHWSDVAGLGDATLSLEFLHNLHIKTPDKSFATK